MLLKKPKKIRWDLTSTDTRVLKLVDVVYADLNLGTQKVKIKKELLKTFLLNLLMSSKISRAISYPRDMYWYQNLPSKYKYPFLTYHFVIKIIDGLIEKEYIKHETGFWDMQLQLKEQSEMRPAKKLLDLYNDLSITNTSVVEYRPPIQEIILRKIERVKVLNKKTGKNNTVKKKVLLNYDETSQTIAFRKTVREWNALRYQTNITLDVPSDMLRQDEDYERFSYYCNWESQGDFTHFVVKPKGAYRVFLYDFEKYGRFAGMVETLIKKDYRQFFKINGDATVELDFEAFHVRMLYHLEGMDYQNDPYQVAADSYKNVKYKNRKLFKKLGLMAINASSKPATIKGLRTKLLEGDNPIDIPYEVIEDMLKYWLEVHKPIAKYLCSNIGLKLMHLDSQIAEKVIKYFTEKGIMILCVHDSFIIARSYENELRAIMAEAYKEIVKTNFKVVIDKK